MENASKALIIAGEVLIAILLLTLFVYVFRLMSQSSSRIYTSLDETKIAQFNQKFINFEGRGVYPIGKDKDGNNVVKPLSIQEVATIVNLAIENNKNNKFSQEIVVLVDGNDWAEKYKNEPATRILEDNISANKTYKCESVKINQTTLVVSEVTIFSN